MLCTKKGIIKKTALEDFSNPRKTGVNAITIVEGDELLVARLTTGNSEVMHGREKRSRHPIPRRKSTCNRPWRHWRIGN